MNTQTRVAAYLVGLAVVFAAAIGIGGAVGPAGDRTHSPAQPEVSHGGMYSNGNAGS
ncbi:hypothetical protein GCM10010531_15690 [Blastococcus jejuensis]|uniref:Uncharacterized protein n=1 Tax=Blastococcus jejuensis TaxID=351224 RepID=A0ABP6P291_9ACTN